VPLGSLSKFMSTLCNALIIEFVPKEDSNAQKLLVSRKDIFTEYHQEGFEEAFQRDFRIIEKESIPDSLRTLYLLEKR